MTKIHVFPQKTIQNIVTNIKMSKQLFTGPELPYDIAKGAMASSPDGNGVILFGGYRSSTGTFKILDSILELKSDGEGWLGSWTILTAKLQYARYRHVVIPVVMDIDTCGINGIVSSNTSKIISHDN